MKKCRVCGTTEKLVSARGVKRTICLDCRGKQILERKNKKRHAMLCSVLSLFIKSKKKQAKIAFAIMEKFKVVEK